jgi:hypothetical protein
MVHTTLTLPTLRPARRAGVRAKPSRNTETGPTTENVTEDHQALGQSARSGPDPRRSRAIATNAASAPPANWTRRSWTLRFTAGVFGEGSVLGWAVTHDSSPSDNWLLMSSNIDPTNVPRQSSGGAEWGASRVVPKFQREHLAPGALDDRTEITRFTLDMRNR